MTLARAALRLATVGALAGVKGARPTLAENRVFDSRIGAIDPKSLSDAKPILIVQTDGDEGTPTDMKDGVSPAGGPPFWRNVDLVIELSMVAQADEGQGFAIGYPVTDAALEAQLDFLEGQIWLTLAYGATAIAAAFRKIAKIHGYESHRAASDEHGDRVAARILTLKCRVHDGCPMPPRGATGLDALPAPLSTVAKAVAPGSYAAEACAKFAEALVAVDRAKPPLPALRSLGMGFDFALSGEGDGTPDVSAELVLNPG
ncbi:hypothetical protein [Methylobacterium organophilum]|uniref:Uncharacterized protein n=1 Tax=Methylobacterium organophilum TaxID=410 RepID=A0ABQ4TC50_METOR|nr:hypothetical protein [Methylobacterium organophilum]UMY19131.1 hypothetical protein MMB17_07480 [Methylobacterium organophilum]GJE27951.1 hypothetical protein LKMONMHP_2813 [Methylobacterium organophilum]